MLSLKLVSAQVDPSTEFCLAKHYNHAMRIHQHMLEVLERRLIKKFMEIIYGDSVSAILVKFLE